MYKTKVEKFRIGDRIRIIHKGEKEDQTCMILDILEDYDGYSYWLKNEKGKGEKAIDISNFFKQTRLDKRFAKFWNSNKNKRRKIAEKRIKRFQRELSKLES